MTSEVVLQGQLKPFGLLNALQVLHNASLSGALRIHEYGLMFTIHLDHGYVVSASSPGQEPLGERLLAKRRITREELESALAFQRRAAERGRRIPIGPILLRRGLVTQEDLEQCVFDQVIETICLALELPSPYFSFTRFASADPEGDRALVHFQFALLEAFRIADEIREGRAEERKFFAQGLETAAVG